MSKQDEAGVVSFNYGNLPVTTSATEETQEISSNQ